MSQKLTKLAADGTDLPSDATDHTAIRIEHELLARPLIVTAHRSPDRLNWTDAAKWAEGLTLNGWSWRLPTVEEAFFMADRTKYPAYDKAFFPDCTGEWIWTSTADAEDPSGCAWFVYLGVGYSLRSDQDSEGFVRAVRAGQQLVIGI